MSHTYRNRHSVPKGYEVRDGGDLYYPTCCANQEAKMASWLAPEVCFCHPWQGTVRYRRSFLRKELKKHRKAHYRQWRSRCKDRMRHGDWDNLPQHRRTGGWLTW